MGRLTMGSRRQKGGLSPLLLVGAIAILGGGAMGIYQSYKQAGIRRNNPGNIEFNPNINWQGQAGTEGVYLLFDTPEHGIRALAKDVYNKITRDGLNTIAALINRYAPPSDNNTVAYIADVSSYTGIGPAVALSADDIAKIVPAIIHHENGVMPYPADLISQAIADAVS
jgi:hypothetical protein